MRATSWSWRKIWSLSILSLLKQYRTILRVSKNSSWNWENMERTTIRNMNNSSGWSWWTWEHHLTCSCQFSTPTGNHKRYMVRITPLNLSMVFELVISIDWLNKEILAVNNKSTCSRERARWILWIEYGLMPLHINIHTTAINLRDRCIHPNAVERRRHVNTMEIMEI